MNNANKPQVLLGAWPGPISWMLKGKHMVRLTQVALEPIKTRARHSVSIMCDLLDLIFISSSAPKTKRPAAVSSTLFEPHLRFYLPANLEWVTHCLEVERSAFAWNLRSCSDQRSPPWRIASGYTVALMSENILIIGPPIVLPYEMPLTMWFSACTEHTMVTVFTLYCNPSSVQEDFWTRSLWMSGFIIKPTFTRASGQSEG